MKLSPQQAALKQREHQATEAIFGHLADWRSFATDVLATIKVNRDKGVLTCADEAAFQKFIDRWDEKLKSLDHPAGECFECGGLGRVGGLAGDIPGQQGEAPEMCPVCHGDGYEYGGDESRLCDCCDGRGLKFRRFQDPNGTQWKMPVDGSPGFVKRPNDVEWHALAALGLKRLMETAAITGTVELPQPTAPAAPRESSMAIVLRIISAFTSNFETAQEDMARWIDEEINTRVREAEQAGAEPSAEQELLSQFAKLCDHVMGAENSMASFASVTDRVGYLLRVEKAYHAKEAPAPQAKALPEFRYFKHPFGTLWRIDQDGGAEWFSEKQDSWIAGKSLPEELTKHGFTETDEHGSPLVRLPEGAPKIPAGYAYIGSYPEAQGRASLDSEDLLAWCKTMTAWAVRMHSQYPDMHYAARIGSEVHKRNGGGA